MPSRSEDLFNFRRVRLKFQICLADPRKVPKKALFEKRRFFVFFRPILRTGMRTFLEKVDKVTEFYDHFPLKCRCARLPEGRFCTKYDPFWGHFPSTGLEKVKKKSDFFTFF